MQARKDGLGQKFHIAFALYDELARFESIRELFDLIDDGKANIEDGITELISGIKQENALMVLSYIWARLEKMKPNDNLKSFAESELDNPDAEHRRYALKYLGNRYPEDREKLYNRMSRDLDYTIIFEIGKLILSLNPKLAVQTWLRILGIGPHVLAEEVLPMFVGQYADDETIIYLKQLHTENPDDSIIEMTLWFVDRWNMVDYLDAKEPVGIGEGYWIKCPNCDIDFAVRDGHAGERGRCHKCQKEFIIPLMKNE